MKKTTKHIITITVYVLIILYFLAFSNRKPVDPRDNTETICKNFDVKLSDSIEEYFTSNSKLPEENGEELEVEIDDLISEGYLTSEDFQEVGTSCTGSGYVSRVNDRFYYYNDITCGQCSIDNMYTEWSDWDEELPNFNGRRYQVKTQILYNYGTSEEKWTEWSDWGEKIEKIKDPEIPKGVEIVNTETREKKQYKYRTATYKWYKLSENVEYYNSGSYSETAPSGYERLENSKAYSRTTKAYLTSTDLKQKENVKDGDPVVDTKGYKVKTPKYIYSYTTPSTTETTNECEVRVTKYMCYKNNTYQVADISESQSTTLSTCKSQQPDWSSTCTTYVSTPANPGTEQCTGGTYTFTISMNATIKGTLVMYTNDGGYIYSYNSGEGKQYWGSANCNVSCNRLPGNGTECDNVSYQIDATALCLKSPGFASYGDVYKYCQVNGETYKFGKKKGYNTLYNINQTYSCSSTYNRDGTCTIVGATPAKYGYKYTTKTYDTSGYYETCPSGYPNKDTSETTTECTKYKTRIIPGTTYYLKSDGSLTTNINSAAYLTDTQYNSLKSKDSSLSNYKKTGTPQYEYETTNYIEGSCPSGKTCDTTTMYKAIIYKYKWFKKGTSTKTWCNNQAYSETSPASGCIKDASTAKWSDWSEYSDEEVKKTESNEVETQTLISYRRSYIDSKDLVLKEWYTYEEFEEKTGLRIEDLKNDENVKVQEKIVYKYRILK